MQGEGELSDHDDDEIDEGSDEEEEEEEGDDDSDDEKDADQNSIALPEDIDKGNVRLEEDNGDDDNGDDNGRVVAGEGSAVRRAEGKHNRHHRSLADEADEDEEKEEEEEDDDDDVRIVGKKRKALCNKYDPKKARKRKMRSYYGEGTQLPYIYTCSVFVSPP
jgi:hypothetical protein